MVESKFPKTLLFFLLTLLFTLLVVFQLYQATTWGAGLSPDSVTYFKGAGSILSNWNLERIGNHYPPLYFVLIALTALVSGDVLEALRWLQIVTIIGTFLLFTLLAWKGTNRSLLPTMICSLLFVTSQPVLHIHAMAWSEASFCFFALVGVYFLVSYLDPENSHFSTLAFSALFIGLAFITRYVGITLIVTSVLVLLIYNERERGRRFIDSFYFILISCLPMLLWTCHNWLVGNGASSRDLVVHVIPMKKIHEGIQVLLDWLFIPHNYSFVLLGVSLFIVMLYVLTAKDGKDFSPITGTCFIFIFVYILFLLLSISLFDAHTPLDRRILYPVYLFFVLGIVLLTYRLYEIRKFRGLSYLLFCSLLFLAYSQVGVQQQYLARAIDNGLGFAGKKLVQSDMLRWVKKLPDTAIIYTNGPDAITVYANRPSKMLPPLVTPTDMKPNDNIQNDVNEMASKIAGNKGVIIYFNGITWRWYLPTIDHLAQVLPLQIVHKTDDGIAVIISSQVTK